MKQLFLKLFVTLVAFVAPALAHTIWIEPLDGNMVIRFAEPGNKFEKSPGHLDALTPPVSFIFKTNSPVAVDSPKHSDHFALNGASVTNVVCTESIFTVRAKRKPYFYARWQAPTEQGAAPLLTLDLVPNGKAGEVRIYLRGKPMPNIKATLYTPDGKENELISDTEGLLHFSANAPGQYLLAVAHQRENISGFHLGRFYEETSHNAALSWKQD